jgi:hypothetical protein
MSSSKRAATEVLSEEPVSKRTRTPEMRKMPPSEIKYGVEILVKHYQLKQVQRADLETVAEDAQFVPTVEDVEWLATQARLREHSTYELDVWLFPYVEHYPWYLRSEGEDHRLFLGVFNCCDGLVWELWAGFTLTAKGAKCHLYHHGPKPEKEDKSRHRLVPSNRRFLTWLPSLNICFRIERMLPTDYEAPDTIHAKAAALQDAYIKGMMKVLARFPGLILERDEYDDYLRWQLHGPQWSAWPFKCREESSKSNPLAKLSEILCTRIVENAGMEEDSDTDEDEDTDEDIDMDVDGDTDEDNDGTDEDRDGNGA